MTFKRFFAAVALIACPVVSTLAQAPDLHTLARRMRPGAEPVLWPLFDLVLIADTLQGIELLGRPSMQSQQGFAADLHAIRFDPGEALAWTVAARAALDSIPSAGPNDLRALLPMLVGLDEGTGIGISRQGVGQSPPLFLIIRNLRGEGWRAEGGREDALRFLDALERSARKAHLSSDSVRHAAGNCGLPTPPEKIDGPVVHYPAWEHDHGVEGRVLAEFVLDTTGHPDPSTFNIVITSGEAFSYEATRVVMGMTFRPARLCQRPVRVLVHVPFSFLMAHR